MIDSSILTRDAARAEKMLNADIAARLTASPELSSFAELEYHRAKSAERTALSESVFRAGLVDQAAASWVLGVILVRFLEDTGLIGDPVITGPGSADQRARDRLQLHFRAHPDHAEREYLEAAFRELAGLPGLGELFGEQHQLLYALGPSADGAKSLIEWARRRDPESGLLLHDFTDPSRSTRFLGDLYQDLSELAKKRYALLQTPEFVERFILERTLEPAVAEFGLEDTSLIDPACGSGHFLLGAFERLMGHWRERDPHAEGRLLAQRCLDQIAGVDLNPVAVAICRFRLLVAALSAAGSRTLAEAPDFHINLAAADSLLHGPRPGQLAGAEGSPARNHHYRAEDVAAATRILSRSYACVVGNPPYITPRDPGESAAYRARYGSCHRKYSLAVPFTERFFDLAQTDPAGYVGMITANGFMKREFGTVLVKDFLPTWDLTHVIDTSGAYIPGHGTPTVILLARNRPPREKTVRAALGIRGEPSPPKDPARGLVWSAIEDQIDEPGSESEFISVVDLPRERLSSHPWSLGGGGAAELKELIERGCRERLSERWETSGFTAISGEDDIYAAKALTTWRRLAVSASDLKTFAGGDSVRDWALDASMCLFPRPEERPLSSESLRYLWPTRSLLEAGLYFGKSKEDRGLQWWAWAVVVRDKWNSPLSICFAFVSTHNHFVLDRQATVFKQSAPVIKLPSGVTENDHFRLIGLLNSSAACFWMKQTFFNKGSSTDSEGARVTAFDTFYDAYEHDSTKLARFPLPADPPAELARMLDSLAQEAQASTPAAVCEQGVPSRQSLDDARAVWESTRRRMVAFQEELDWRCYSLYGVTGEDLTYGGDPPEVAFAERAFEIVLGRKVASGDVDTAWFTRHRAEPITEIPERWPADYRALVERRISLIESSRDIGLIERPEYKRRWAHEPWEVQERAALRGWLLDRLEDPRYWNPDAPEPQSVGRLSDLVRDDPDFVSVLGLYLGRDDYDLVAAIGDLVVDECVPYLAAYRYTDGGMVKRAEWEQVWELQRAEDRGEQVGEITPPPRYGRTDFRRPSFWTLRGKLDVPKERFISYPGAEREADPTLLLGWAGWDHRQQAIALAGYLARVQDTEGWSKERLQPLLAGLQELIPWLLQWHDEPDGSGVRFGQFAQTVLADRSNRAGLTTDDLKKWRPPAPTRGRRRERLDA